MHFYVFNITNVEEVQIGGKPALQQLGPYTYTKHSRKLDARFDMAGRVHFKPYTFYTVSPVCPTGQGWHGIVAGVLTEQQLRSSMLDSQKGLMSCLARPGVLHVWQKLSSTVWHS